jgi:hypothetical protein
LAQTEKSRKLSISKILPDKSDVAPVEVSPQAVDFPIDSGLRDRDENTPETSHLKAIENGLMAATVSEETEA